MGYDAQDGQPEGEAVDDAEKQLQRNDCVDEAGEEAFGEHGMLLDEL